MKKIIKFFILFISVFSISFLDVNASDKKINIYFFHGDGCPHCALEETYLNQLKKSYPNVNIIKYEVWYNKENSKFMDEIKEKLNIDSNGVPLTIIGSTSVVGYNEVAADKIDRIIHYYLDHNYVDYVSKIKNGIDIGNIKDEFSEYEKESDKALTISVPFIGKVNLKQFPIITASILIGLVDGFNPCAMWVLLFLISMLLGMKDKKRMWVLGVTFLATSAIIYMLIMLSWFNIVVNITTSIIMRNIIAIIAIIGSIINIRQFFKNQDSGCTVTDNKKRRKILEKIKKFTAEKSLILSVIGVVGLAISVNVIELACSAGLPLVFTQILAINHVSGFHAFLYTLIYILFFLIDDIIVFTIAMFSMKVTSISTKYNKYSHLIGGIIMLIIGILLIFAPELLMFNFK